jgi:hypothetical protein
MLDRAKERMMREAMGQVTPSETPVAQAFADVIANIEARQMAAVSRLAEAADVDGAYLVAPQDVKLPEAIKLLATTGRGKVPSIRITQRLQEIDEAVISRNNANLLGGFGSDRDRGKLDAEYPVEVHNPEADQVPNLPAELHHPEDGPVPLQKTEVDGVVRSSEWIYSTDEGEMERLDSASIEMTAKHYGGSDQKLRHPFDS